MKRSSKILVIDTATKYIYLSLIMDGEEKAHIYEEGINNHSVTIIPFLEKILNEEKIGLRDLTEVIVGIGPGSYTGVRIGVTVAKMIGYLNDIDVYSVSSLALMASSSKAEYVLPLIDARRGNAFMALYHNNNNILEKVVGDVLENINDFESGLTQPFQVITSGNPEITKIIHSELLTKVSDINGLTPNYLQKTEAERNRESK